MSEPDHPRRDADAKAWFYLDHREDIRSWAALEKDARDLVDRYLVELADDVRELALGLGVEHDETDVETGSWPRMCLARDSWVLDGVPWVDVRLEWERSRLLSGQNTWPYVGVRVHQPEARSGLTAAARAGFADLRRQRRASASAGWPMYEPVAPADPSRVDPLALRVSLLARLEEVWEAAAPVVDVLHAGLSD